MFFVFLSRPVGFMTELGKALTKLRLAHGVMLNAYLPQVFV
jgi:hypothetical protein